MFKRLNKNKKAQNTAEYAILISLVVAGIIAMQTYAQRALQGRVRAASQFATENIAASDPKGVFGDTAQYEPYYLTTQYEINRDSYAKKELTGDQIAGVKSYSSENRTRLNKEGTGYQKSSYNAEEGAYD